MSVFASWPPDVTTEQLEQLTLLAATYALSHSLLYLPPASPENPPPPSPESAIHAPISLIPTPIPRHIFAQALTLQRAYNTLYARIALDVSFLDQIMGPGGVADVDDFTSALWSAWKQLRDDGVPPVRRLVSDSLFCADEQTNKPLHLGLFRSDYLLHQPTPDDSILLKQVEFNTIASSFGSLSPRVAGMHRCVAPMPFGYHAYNHLFSYLSESTGYFGISPLLSPSNLPNNDTTEGLASGLAEAHRAYGVPKYVLLKYSKRFCE
jgi:hypothetical protein